ncbi:putative phage protein (TIGR02218 family) [Phyllobacterium myrsinacearum]|uniref:DUF2163 domain-containing protein n=1 Tax=Phyllobacterium myrsinacearum TaxID=28101 RepID=UPI001029108A|nr:DUF2163 domain-containing protein [Phyllobacterium myrsinacearum]RZS88563.1 putative phage protein (TIGR02218 family) [Phyllobacterium myrsinacearum]
MSHLMPELESHLAGDVTTHCFYWIIRRADEVVLGFTDHDRILNIERVACEPQTGLTASEATSALGLAVDGAEVEGALSSLRITESDVECGAFDNAHVETFLVNWAAPEQRVLLRRARIGTVTRSGGRFVAELKSSAVDLDRVKGRRIRRLCDAELGDARCGYSGGKENGSIAGVISDRAFLASGLHAAAANWFRNGVLTWDSGGNAGRTNVVTGQETAGNDIRLDLRDAPVPDMRKGDTFSLLPGCDKSFGTCKAKFSNAANFRGFPHLPGNDAAYNYADGSGNFDGGVLVP